MKLTLGLQFAIADGADGAVEVTTLLKNPDQMKKLGAAGPRTWQGTILLRLDGKPHCSEYVDPLLPLVEQWLLKVPWIIGGDTETVPLRNSTECFAFMPAGDGVELSMYEGDEQAIQSYVLEPVTIRLENFVTEVISVGDKIVSVLKGAAVPQDHEDCRDFLTSLSEAQRAWKDHQVRQRR